MKKFLLIALVFFSFGVLYAQTLSKADTKGENTNISLIEEKEPEIKIFPVPVLNNRFTITSDTPFKFVRMTNIIGQEIAREKLLYPVARKVIEFPGAEKGIYLVTIEFEDNRKLVRKILVDSGR